MLQRRRRSLFELINTNYAPYKHLGERIDFLEVYGERAGIHDFSIIQYKFQPSLILRFGKIVHVLESSTTHTKLDNQCG